MENNMFEDIVAEGNIVVINNNWIVLCKRWEPWCHNLFCYLYLHKEYKNLTLDEYQQLALETAIYPNPIIYPTLGLTGEAGEVSYKVKKVLRDNDSVFTEEKKLEIAKEIGDVLWYCATLSHDIGFKLSDIGKMNYDKLHSRQLRGKLHGSGDNR